MAWSFGWSEAQEASGREWMAPHLAQLLDDPYHAVRYIAQRSLKTLPEYRQLRYDFMADKATLRRGKQQALALWPGDPSLAKDPLRAARLLFENLEWVRVYYLWRPNLPDEADNHVVELVVAGSAEAIFTHNKRDFARADLHFSGLRVLTPGELIAED